MKRFWEACVAALFGVGLLAGCNDYNNSIQSATGATITALSPSGVLLGSPDFTLTVTASRANGFSSNSLVNWNEQRFPACVTNGTMYCTTAVSTTVITARIPASLVAKAGAAYVNVYAPQSGTGMNGLSNSLAFSIYGAPNPVPSLTSISPTSTAVCTSNCKSVTMKLTGTNFLPSSSNGASTVTYTGTATGNIATGIQVTSLSSTQITAVIPATYLAANDTAQINVVNPPSGICLVSCPDLGGGTTGPSTPGQQGSNTTQVFTVGSGATPATASASLAAEETPALSKDGRYVVFTAPQNSVTQILLSDTCIGVDQRCVPSTAVVSVGNDNAVGNNDSHSPVISADGRFVAFSSSATNLVTDATIQGKQIFLRDTCNGAPAACKPATSLVSTDPNGTLIGTEAILPSISSSGRYVAFVAVTPDHTADNQKAASSATPNSGLRQVFLRDTCLGETNCVPKTTRISSTPSDAPANPAKPAGPALSGEAKQIALADARNSTVFTRVIPVEQQVYVALPAEPK